MDMDDLTPSDAGSLRAALRPATAEPVATFTPTGVTHPDAIWSPRGSELARRPGRHSPRGLPRWSTDRAADGPRDHGRRFSLQRRRRAGPGSGTAGRGLLTLMRKR